jgi:multiple sugar transport system substrate-binding protein
MKRGLFVIASFLITLSLVMAGCGGAKESENPPNTKDSGSSQGIQAKAEPVTLKVFLSTNFTDADVQKYFVPAVKAVYPNITLKTEVVTTVDLPNRVAAGDYPDIALIALSNIEAWREADIVADLNPLVKANKMDLKRFDPSSMKLLNDIGANQYLYGLPFLTNYTALFYSKDIFNKFGVEYPKDGMSWEETATLTRKVARQDNGVQYYGFGTNPVYIFGAQTSQTMVDPKTNKATLDTDKWNKTFQLLKSLYDIPGNLPVKGKNPRDTFFKDQTLAMLADWGNGVLPLVQKMVETGKAFDWDMVTLPYVDKPGIGRNVDAHLAVVSKVGKHQQEAFQVLSVITSDKVQIQTNRNGMYTSLDNTEIKKQFGADMDILKNKNIAAIYKTKSADTPNRTLYDQIARSALDAAFQSVIYDGNDINSALRDAQEKATLQINEKLNK